MSIIELDTVQIDTFGNLEGYNNGLAWVKDLGIYWVLKTETTYSSDHK